MNLETAIEQPSSSHSERRLFAGCLGENREQPLSGLEHIFHQVPTPSLLHYASSYQDASVYFDTWSYLEGRHGDNRRATVE